VSQSLERLSQLSEIRLENENNLPPRVTRDGRQPVPRRVRAAGQRQRHRGADHDRYGEVSGGAAKEHGWPTRYRLDRKLQHGPTPRHFARCAEETRGAGKISS